jgi:GntR family transcriptional regulator
MTGRTAGVAHQLRERIALGDLGPGGALESEAALGARYDVSRVTVRRALEELREQGLVESRRGAGWFATAGTFHQALAVGTFRHAASAVASAGKTVERRVAGFGFGPASPAVAEALRLQPGSEVLTSRSVRTVDAAPLDLVDEWVPAALAGDVSRHDAEVVGIWATLGRLGHAIDTVRQTVTAAVATDLDAELLDTPPGSALLLVRRLALGATGEPLALSDHRYLAHRFSLEVEFRGWSGGAAGEPPGLRRNDVPTPRRTSAGRPAAPTEEIAR